jgi:hypothetical protein
MPDNYKLMFSYSPEEDYQKQVQEALKTDVPISAVFEKEFPLNFLGRPVIDGDQNDLINVKAGRVIVGLKYKQVAGVRREDQNLIVRQAA